MHARPLRTCELPDAESLEGQANSRWHLFTVNFFSAVIHHTTIMRAQKHFLTTKILLNIADADALGYFLQIVSDF